MYLSKNKAKYSDINYLKSNIYVCVCTYIYLYIDIFYNFWKYPFSNIQTICQQFLSSSQPMWTLFKMNDHIYIWFHKLFIKSFSGL